MQGRKWAELKALGEGVGSGETEVLGHSQVLTVEALPTLQRWALRNGVLAHTLLRDVGNGWHIRESSLEFSGDFSPFVYISMSFVLGHEYPVRTTSAT